MICKMALHAVTEQILYHLSQVHKSIQQKCGILSSEVLTASISQGATLLFFCQWKVFTVAYWNFPSA